MKTWKKVAVGGVAVALVAGITYAIYKTKTAVVPQPLYTLVCTKPGAGTMSIPDVNLATAQKYQAAQQAIGFTCTITQVLGSLSIVSVVPVKEI